jgi:hypothetical protein
MDQGGGELSISERGEGCPVGPVVVGCYRESKHKLSERRKEGGEEIGGEQRDGQQKENWRERLAFCGLIKTWGFKAMNMQHTQETSLAWSSRGRREREGDREGVGVMLTLLSFCRCSKGRSCGV